MNERNRKRLLYLETNQARELVILPDEDSAFSELSNVFQSIESMVNDGRLCWPVDQVKACRSELHEMKPTLRTRPPANGDVQTIIDTLKLFGASFVELLAAAGDAFRKSRLTTL